MFKNYFKIAFRNLIKHKLYSMLNICGLAIGLAASIVIGVYIFNETSYDRYHEKSDRIYRVGTFAEFGGDGLTIASANFPIGPTLKSEYPEVENSVRLRRFGVETPITYDATQYVEKNVFYADPSFFDIFSFKMLTGNPETALEKPYSVVLTKKIADKIFKNEQPIGKLLKLFDQDKLYTVTGVVENVPENSHFTFTELCSFESMREQVGAQMERWMGDFQNYTYILLHEGADYKKLEVKFPDLIQKNIGELLSATNGKFELFLQPLNQIYLYSNTLNETGKSGDIRYIYIFSGIAFLILLIACINFLNLSTARFAIRSKEIGVNKVQGAKRSQLIFQFLWESIFFTLLAVIIALMIISLIWPLVHEYTGLESSIFFENIFFFAGGLIVLSLLVGLAAGSYPAFYLSSFQPTYNLKDSKIGKISSKFRNTLVVVQFVISISLIGCTGVIFNQLNYLQNKNLGFKKDHVVVVPYDFKSSTRSVKSLKNELLARPEILSVTTSFLIPGQGGRQNLFVPEGSTPENAPIINATYVDSDFLPTMKIELIKGRNFSNEYSNDPKESIIINETAAKRFGWENPIGKKVTEAVEGHPTKIIIGVVKDYHFFPLYAEIAPLILENEESGENQRINYFLVSIAPSNIKKSVRHIQRILENKNSMLPYQFFFLDENFNSHYNSEMQLSRIFSYFTTIAILLACLGLFGLAAYTAEQRTKEIGIRKVLGATVNSVVFMLTKEFLKWVLLANIVAWPIIYYGMNKWLQNFAYRIDLTIWSFLLAGGAALAIALLTVSWQAIRAAMANPVESLRYE